MKEKENLNDYIAKISNIDLMISVEDHINWQLTGMRKFEHTILDDIYDNYFSYTEENRMFNTYNIITREVAKRVFNKQI